MLLSCMFKTSGAAKPKPNEHFFSGGVVGVF